MINCTGRLKITRREFARRLGQIGVGAGVFALTDCGSCEQDKGTFNAEVEKGREVTLVWPHDAQ
jgi:hypothetical protein